jgi:hypothetical protein
VLAKYYIGDLAADLEPKAEGLALDDELADGTFYAVLKKRVAAYFRANKVCGCSRVGAVDQHASFANWVSSGAVQEAPS